MARIHGSSNPWSLASTAHPATRGSAAGRHRGSLPNRRRRMRCIRVRPLPPPQIPSVLSSPTILPANCRVFAQGRAFSRGTPSQRTRDQPLRQCIEGA